MSGAHKPRRIKYLPTAHTMTIALGNAAKPSQQDVAEVLQAVTTAHTALRLGVATELQWAIFSGSLEVARSIHRIGVVRDLSGHLGHAHHALQAIYDRAMHSGRWVAPALWFDELEALAVFVDLHAFQARQLSRAEFLRAIDMASTAIKTAGHTAHVLRSVPTQFGSQSLRG